MHVYTSTGRFRSFAEMRSFIEETYDEDGDSNPSDFMREIALRSYEPGCIEAIYSVKAIPLQTLLAKASYSDQWLGLVSGRDAAEAICAYEPNVVENPQGCSLTYIGAFPYTHKSKGASPW